MGLRLRRGTNANRLLFTPTEGELLYVTDYATAGVSALWVGDGITLGGNPVDTDTDTQLALNNFSISDLGDVNVGVDSTAPQDGDFLAYNADAGDWDPRTPTMQALGDYNASGITDGEFLRYNAAGGDFRNVTLSTGLLEDIDYSVPPTAGQVLKYNAVDGSWAPADDTDTTLVLGGQSIGDLGDVNLTHDSSQPTHGDTLVWDSVDNEFKSQATIQNIGQLNDVNTAGVQVNDYLIWTGSSFDAIPNPLYDPAPLAKSTVGTHTGAVVGTRVSADEGFFGTLNGDSAGTHNGPSTGVHTGPVIGDVTGSIFAGDSTLLINSATGDVFANILDAGSVETNIINDKDQTGIFNINVSSAGGNTQPRLLLTGDGTAGSGLWILTDDTSRTLAGTDNIGRILFRAIDASGTTTPVVAIARKDEFVISVGAKNEAETFKMATATGNYGLGIEPSADAKVNVGGAMLLGNMDTTTRDALTPANGMIIYNTTDNKFQGYENGAWANLI